ncbi:MAG TPA: hypothetical protein VN578_23075 [Candidatus Binatia bacterium]|nr:hypothetical protein [Candidatus Binatia bacterium]
MHSDHERITRRGVLPLPFLRGEGWGEGLVALVLFLSSFAFSAAGASTINATNKFAYGANFGWIDWRGDTNAGAVIGEYVCSGYLYAANVGWISLGSGSPANGIQYQNNSAADFGVNTDGLGNLRGYAYGANIGWINFESTGAPRVNLLTGNLTGSVYSANCGWIGLSNSFAHVQTDTIPRGTDSDSDGLPDAWELTYFGHLGVNPNAHPNGDGMSYLQEYLAGTNPTNENDALVITSYNTTPGGTAASFTWQSVLTRFYYLDKTLDLQPPAMWLDSGLGIISPDGATTTRLLSDTNAPKRFYRVRAFRPLTP